MSAQYLSLQQTASMGVLEVGGAKVINALLQLPVDLERVLAVPIRQIHQEPANIIGVKQNLGQVKISNITEHSVTESNFAALGTNTECLSKTFFADSGQQKTYIYTVCIKGKWNSHLASAESSCNSNRSASTSWGRNEKTKSELLFDDSSIHCIAFARTRSSGNLQETI